MDDISITKAVTFIIATVIALIIFIGLSALGVYGFNYFKVLSYEYSGKGQLMQAQSNRRIEIEEAKARKESAKELAEAEIIRAQGMAEANKIIGKSLEQNEKYLHYLWIQTLEKSKNKIIYIPTETSLPILEASRAVNLDDLNQGNVKK